MGTIREDFSKFLKQGNLVQLAIAFVIGAAFSAVIAALVADLITPLIGAAGHLNFSGWNYDLNGSKFQQGLFLNALISFIIVAIVVFFLIALPYQRYQDRKTVAAAVTTRACPECLTQIPLAAKKCSACTSSVTPVTS